MSARAPIEIEEGAPPSAAYSAGRSLLARWLRVPFEPPTIPPGRHSWARSFRPAEAYLRYLRMQHGLLWGLFGLLAIGVTVVAAGSMWAEGLVIPALLVTLLVCTPVLLWLIAGLWTLQLQFDTTWYVMTDRAIRIRTGIWVIKEQTVTFENAQNVRVRRGPLQRWLGIGNVTVETASVGSTDQHGNTTPSTASVVGVANPHAIRDRIAERMRASRNAGLGNDSRAPSSREAAGADDHGKDAPAGDGQLLTGRAVQGWSPAHLEVLREIREEVRKLGSDSGPR